MKAFESVTADPVRPPSIQASGRALEVVEITTEDGFDSLRSDWNRLAARLEVPSPFHSWEWNRFWWRHFGAGQRLCLLAFRRDGQITGIAQLYKRSLGRGPIKVPVLVPVGWEGYGRGKGITEQLEFLFPPETRDDLFGALAVWLEARPWTAIIVSGLHEQGALPSWFGAHQAVAREPVEYPYRELPDSWDEFVKTLNKSMRDNVKYYPRLMVRKGHPFEFEVARTPEAIQDGLSVFFELHRARAESQMRVHHGNRFRYPRRRAFVREVAPLLAAQGELRIGMLKVRGEAVAAQMWLEKGQTMFMNYSGYKPEWAEYSVGMVCAAEAFKDGISRGITRVEFLQGSGQFKQRWDTQNRIYRSKLFTPVPAAARSLLRIREAIGRFT